VVLVIDARGMTRGVAPLILGYQAFDPDIRIAGVILNNLGGSRHESKLRAVIEHYTDVEVIGAVQHDASMQIAERHLGLVPANEQDAARARIRMWASGWRRRSISTGCWRSPTARRH
jgi:cobyrinic acid a,c-diamide synthase